MTPNDYVAKMMPYAQQASGGTSLPPLLILAQWAHETGWGSSQLAVNHNNHGGIKYTSHADYQADEYSGYNSPASFATDYVRVLHNGYYDELLQAAAAGRSASELAGLFGPYAEDPAYPGKLRAVMQTVSSVSPIPGSPTAIQDGDTIHVIGAGFPQLSSSALTAVAVVVGAMLVAFSLD